MEKFNENDDRAIDELLDLIQFDPTHIEELEEGEYYVGLCKYALAEPVLIGVIIKSCV